MSSIVIGCFVGFIAWFLTRYLAAGLYTVNQNERAVKTSFGRAERIGDATTLEDPIAESLSEEEKPRYNYPQVRVIPPGGPYFKWPWERVYKVSIATQTMNMACDPEDPNANYQGTDPGGRDQRPVEHRAERTNSLSRFGEESLRLYVWREVADCACDGLFRFGVARAHRKFRGPELRSNSGRRATSELPRPRWESPSMICARICGTSMIIWIASARHRRRVTGSLWMPR